MNSLKLNKLKTHDLPKDRMREIRGGNTDPVCSCGCCYVASGGSSIAENMTANYNGGLWTKCNDDIIYIY
ncbi:MAG TPA: hypothetical protein DCR43_04820 [Bacteroidales bacterium]|nr:MAG: hypothetical protein A2X11_01740 [Bacteroidetes bacterium GWE2_42_24]OFY29715.1 MAG: hypothetical protein A2X09_01430 [Bacteroidetes bacterium GWF2_43_11]HAQ65162.1 hypothetical protein [Bacteroidales bacterium]HBZ65833.1 hypothetical protein [Bacteroidales bacterium]